MARDWLKGAKSFYDVVVIGSGLAGMTSANLLARLGHRVLLAEHHYNLGGMATWFKRRGGHILDISLHGFPVGMIKTFRKYWTREIADSVIQLKGVHFDNPQFTLNTTFDKIDFTRILRDHFGIMKHVIDDFFTTVRGMNFYDDLVMTTGELFEKFFPGRKDVWRFLMEPITYANGSTLDDPALTYGIVFSNFMDKGVFTYQGGTDQLIKKMKKELLKNGVEIRNHCLVEKILIEDRAVQGVRINGKNIGCNTVLSNSNLLNTVHRLAGDENFTPEFIEEVKKVRLNNSSCQVYMGIRKGEKIDYRGDLLFSSDADEYNTEKILSQDVTSRTFSFYYPEIRPGTGRYSIVASTNAKYDDWAHLDEKNYQIEKNRLIENTLNSLEKYLPGVRKKIDHVEAATPKTFKRYTLHPSGTSFGTKFEGLKISRDLPKQISGLFHSGSVGIIMSGWLGAANYGVIVANEVDKFVRSMESKKELISASV
ncbi:MAG: phytoene dehydrogenase [Nitrospinaceae bacterium]|nr:MAG: phytoene dehydrogenase [Nitrospinaceae bacterium]